tara:strand:- start:333 stop:920 length:588 start_codon:yes stop_codon:yes gene_type:complete
MNELNQIINKLKTDWKKNLKSKGVKLPTGSKLIELACLYSYMPRPISQDGIEKWHLKFDEEYKRQARHLADAGWYIKSGNNRFTRGIYEKKFKRNEMSLHSVIYENPVWSRNNIKRVNNLSNDNWKEILEKFKKRGCAVCGRQMDHYDKGHLLKSKSYDRNNIVPMCVECNNWGQELEFKEYRDLVYRPIIKSSK